MAGTQFKHLDKSKMTEFFY